MESSIIKKLLMALSGLFLIIFIAQHLFINLTSILPDNGKTFNAISHFMGYNAFVQFVLQPILVFGVMFHFIMGFILEFQNRKTRNQKYIVSKTRASWASKNMIVSGLVVLSFLFLHFYDFWIPEIEYKYISPNTPDSSRYFEELVHKFKDNVARTMIYCVSFLFLGLHLVHGFSSSLQTMGLKQKYLPMAVLASNIFSFFITVGFVLIAVIHYFH